MNMKKFPLFKNYAENYLTPDELKHVARLCLEYDFKNYEAFRLKFIELAELHTNVPKGLLGLAGRQKPPRRKIKTKPSLLDSLVVSVGGFVELIKYHDAEPKYIRLCCDEVYDILSKVEAVHVPR